MKDAGTYFKLVSILLEYPDERYVQALPELESAVQKLPPGRPRAGIEAFLADDSHYLYVAVAGEEVVGSLNGYALTHPHTRRPQFLLYEIDVREAWRRRGIGTRLIDAFLAEAKRLDAFGVWVVTDRENTAAMAMYRGCGLVTSDLHDVVFSADFRGDEPERP